MDVPCRVCQSHVTFKSGIICANYGATRGTSHPCQGAWCAKCFNAHDLDTFEVAVPRDFNGASLAEVEDEKRFRTARPGDHLCSAFQCANCQSQNIRGVNLVRGEAESEAFEAVVTRATLDAFWSRASKTVSSHVREVIFIIKYAEMLHIVNPFPRLGPFPRYHHLGMLQAIMVIMRSMEPGRGKAGNVKYGTSRKTRSTFTVLWDISPEAGSDIALSSSGQKARFVATCNPSEGRWYQHFALGCCARMGDIVRQDRAYSIDIVHKLLEMYEDEYQDATTAMSLNSICACMFLLLTCLGGMRGYEAMWTDLSGLRYDVEYCEELDDFSAVSWPIVGRFKSHAGRAGCYMIPIAGTTNSGMQFFKWTQRFLFAIAQNGQEEGWAFQRSDGTRAFASDYKVNIFEKLEIMQATTSLIDPGCEIWEDYGIQRSGRRFFTSHATNMGVKRHLIELQARWMVDRANGDRAVQRSMIHVYSEMRNMKEALIKPSKAC